MASISPLIRRTHRRVAPRQRSAATISRWKSEGWTRRWGMRAGRVVEEEWNPTGSPAFMSRDIYVLPRRRRHTSPRLRHNGECQKSVRAVKSGRNPRSWSRITTGSRSRRAISREDTMVWQRIRLKRSSQSSRRSTGTDHRSRVD